MERYLGDPKIRWSSTTMIGSNNFMDTRMRTYRAGKRQAESWLRGPVHPGVGSAVTKPPIGPNCPACRSGDELRLDISPATDTVRDHHGFSRLGNPWSLKAGEEFIARGRGAPWGTFEVPAGTSRFTLTAHHKIGKRALLWKRSTTSWGFTSSTGESVLPLLVPRYHLPVDLLNRLPAGPPSFRLAIPKLGRDRVRVVKPTVKVSYNGGKTWKRAKVVRKDPNVFPGPNREPAAGQEGAVRVDPTVRQGPGRQHGARDDQAGLADPRGEAAGNAGPSDAGGPQAGPASVPRRACGALTKHQFRCLAMVKAAGRAAMDGRTDPAGYGAHELRDAYNLTTPGAPGQTIAIVIAGDYPTAAKDLNVYRKQFGLPPCTAASGCFTKLNQDAEKGDYPRPDRGWALEAALDLQMASAACPSCKLVLVEAKAPFFGPMAEAVDTAARVADVVSRSYGAQEFNGVQRLARHYNVAGVPMTASAGDCCYEPANFPASAPAVIAVGGTALRHADNERGWKENAWFNGRSGCSGYFAKRPWQTDPACHLRTVADLSAIAAPNTGVAVYDSFGFAGEKGWFTLGGTSTAAPLVAGMIAAAGDADGFTAADLYAHAADGTGLNDVVTGRNHGYCKRSYMCTAKRGYDAPTGHGTPNGLEAFTDVVP